MRSVQYCVTFSFLLFHPISVFSVYNYTLVKTKIVQFCVIAVQKVSVKEGGTINLLTIKPILATFAAFLCLF